MSDRFVIAGLIVLVTNAQGKLRQVPLTLKQSTRVRRFVTKLHEGGLHIAPEDLLLLTEKDAMETFGKLTGKLPFVERWKQRFKKLFHGGSTESSPTTGQFEPSEPLLISPPFKKVRFEGTIEELHDGILKYEQGGNEQGTA